MKLTKSTKYKRFYVSAYGTESKADPKNSAKRQLEAQVRPRTLPKAVNFSKKAGQYVWTCLMSEWNTEVEKRAYAK